MQRYIRKGREMLHCGYKIRNIKADLAKESGLELSTALLIHKNLILEDHERIAHYQINPGDLIWFGTIDEYNEEFGEHIIIEIKSDHTPNAISVTEKVIIKSSDQISCVRSLLLTNHSWIEKVEFYNHDKDLILDDQTIEECGLLENPTIVIKSPILVVTKGSLTNESKSVDTIPERTKTVMRLSAYELSPLIEVFRKLIDTNYPNGSIMSRILNFIHMPDEKGRETKKQFISLISDWVKYFDKIERHELSATELTSIFRQDFGGHLEDAGESIELASYNDHMQSVRKMVSLGEELFKKFLPQILYSPMKTFFESLRVILDTFLISNDHSTSTEKFVDVRLVNLLNYYLETFVNDGTRLDDVELGFRIISLLPDAIPILGDVNSTINQYWSSVFYAGGSKFHKLYVNPNLAKDNAVHIMSATPMTTSETKEILSKTTCSEDDLSKEIYLTTPEYDRFYTNDEKLPSGATLSLVTVSRPDNLKKVELLCTGGYAKVYLYQNKSNGQLSVLKKLRIPENQKLEAITEVIREINIFSRLAPHRKIMQYLNYYMEGRSFFIEMEYMKGGSLRTYLTTKGPLKIKEIRHLSHQILEGLKYLHDKSIFHRDIRADNVLLDDSGNAKLTDFGLSRCFQGLLEDNQTAFKQSGVGTERWMAPEISRTSVYGASADIWSFGVTMIEMVTGQPPYPKLPGTVAQIKIVQTGIIEFDLPQNAELQVFIGSCLKFDPSERLTVDQLLESDFIKSLTE